MTEFAFVKMELCEIPHTGAKIFSTSGKCAIRKSAVIQRLLEPVQNQSIIPSLEHMNRGVAFRDKKRIGRLNLGRTLLSVANIYLQSSISAQKVPTVFSALLSEVPKG